MSADTVCCLIGWEFGTSISKDTLTKQTNKYSSLTQDELEQQLKENEIKYNNFLSSKERNQGPNLTIMQ
jgi:hypothetical protein